MSFGKYYLTVCVPALLLLSPGCGAGHRATKIDAAVNAPTKTITSEDNYHAERSEFDALHLDDPARPSTRLMLARYLLRQVEDSLAANHPEEAVRTFGQALTLYDALELAALKPEPALCKSAEAIERVFRKRGAHEQVLLALSVEIATQAQADAKSETQRRYNEVLSWLTSSVTSTEDTPDGRERVIQDLEAAAALWPSPFVASELKRLYLAAEPERAGEHRDLRELIAATRKHSLAYDLARLELRRSRLDEAAKLLRSLAGGPSDDPPLRQAIERLQTPAATPPDALRLALFFTQRGRDDRDVAERVCRDAAARFPTAPEPHLCAGQLALSLERLGMAMKQFSEAVRLQPQQREAWEEVAKLNEMRLYELSKDENPDVQALEHELSRVEAFYQAAKKQFPQRTLEPSMAGALFEVGRGYYNAGRAKEALRYLDRSLAIEQLPQTLELYGQIHLKKGRPRDAVVMFQRAVSLPKRDHATQLHWAAKLERLLAEALEIAGDGTAAEAMRKAALSDWARLVHDFSLSPEGISDLSVERGKIEYGLGQREAALESFEKAIDATPDRGSVYADVIAFLVPRGELNEALDAYHRALGRNEVSDYLKLYCSLWIVDLGRRAGQSDDPLAYAYLQSADGGKWYDELARWATGRETAATLTDHANSPARKAESAFYRAMHALEVGKPEDAKRLWQEVLDTEMMAFFEYDMSLLYLRLGHAPSTPLVAPGKTPARKAKAPPPGSI